MHRNLLRLILVAGLVFAAIAFGAARTGIARADACNADGSWPNCSTACAITGNDCDSGSDGGVDYGWICSQTGNDCPPTDPVLTDGGDSGFDGGDDQTNTSDCGGCFQIAPVTNLPAPREAAEPPDCSSVAVAGVDGLGHIIWGAEANCTSADGMQEVRFRACLERSFNEGVSWNSRDCFNAETLGGHLRPDLSFYNCVWPSLYVPIFRVVVTGSGTDNVGESSDFGGISVPISPIKYGFGCE